MRKIKSYLKKLFCKHYDADLVRWCVKHIPENEPSCVVAEYQCKECGKYVYIYFHGNLKAEWIEAMGEYKHENFNCTR